MKRMCPEDANGCIFALLIVWFILALIIYYVKNF